MRDWAVGQAGAAATVGQHCPQMTQRRCTCPGAMAGSAKKGLHIDHSIHGSMMGAKIPFLQNFSRIHISEYFRIIQNAAWIDSD